MFVILGPLGVYRGGSMYSMIEPSFDADPPRMTIHVSVTSMVYINMITLS